MNNRNINNHFGDMDLFLMDAILKGHVPVEGNVLDVGCGEGRNGVYFIKEGYDYHGLDRDASKVQLLEYLAKSLKNERCTFEVASIAQARLQKDYDLIIASRVLHFANGSRELHLMWKKLTASLKPGGLIYLSMDSVIASEFVVKAEEEKVEFQDGRVSFGLSEQDYLKLSQSLEEVEPLKTTIYRNRRVQSVGLLRKV